MYFARERETRNGTHTITQALGNRHLLSRLETTVPSLSKILVRELRNRERGTWPCSSFRERSFRSRNLGTISFP
ncbi:hypothetical protein Zm00014a_036480 [Zea mays]|uniref:Uncharacterized protein n=1 Tax=Zea mays TaxID=4577 RepID=A0A3L6FX93_MAIZE|nr:hypothetical protein Zm00014a_036480 [Zea mays]